MIERVRMYTLRVVIIDPQDRSAPTHVAISSDHDGVCRPGHVPDGDLQHIIRELEHEVDRRTDEQRSLSEIASGPEFALMFRTDKPSEGNDQP